MKRFTQILLAAFMAFGINSTVFAQSDNAIATANADVEAQITVTADQNIAYGTLTTGTDDGANIPTQAGIFTVSGTNGASVNLEFAKSDLTLAGSGGDRTLVLNLGTGDGAWEDEATDFATASGVNGFDLDTPETASLPADGDIAVWANPTVTMDGTEVPGAYSGSVTLTATYN